MGTLFKLLILLPVLFGAALTSGVDLHPPGDHRYAQRGASGTVLPGGRILQPFGAQLETGPGPCEFATGTRSIQLASANAGPERFSVTIMERVKTSWQAEEFWARTPNYSLPEKADPNWKGVGCGVAFESDHSLWVSEGGSGKIRLLNTKSGNHERIVDLNQGGWQGSESGELAFDPVRHILYVIDKRNPRIAIVDSRKGQVLNSVPLETAASHFVLSPDRLSVFASLADGRVGIIDVTNPLQPAVRSAGVIGGGGRLLASGDRLFASDLVNDSIRILSGPGAEPAGQIEIRIPGLENLRGIRPAGMAYDPVNKWLLVAETGINAVGVIDSEKKQVLGHIPVGFAPVSVAVVGDHVFVANTQGRGTGPNLRHPLIMFGETPALHKGSISSFVVPAEGELVRLTRLVYAANGMLPSNTPSPRPPEQIRHVVLILQGRHSFDEVFGDLRDLNGNGSRGIQAIPQLARFGLHGIAEGRKQRFSLKNVAVTPNLHAIADHWAFSDNFYLASPLVFGAGIAEHLQKNGVTLRVMHAEDTETVISRLAASPDSPSLDVIFLNEPTGSPESERHPYEASLAADGDFVTGRIVEAVSHSSWWNNTVVFATEQGSETGLDHIDSHRVPFVAAGPWIRRNYASHTNSDACGLLKTVFRLLGVPPLELADATARDLTELFTLEPDFAPYQTITPDQRLFDPQTP